MPVSDQLYTLIQSLTKTEKRFFRLYSALQQGEKNYLKLFTAIDIQVSKGNGYDEKILLKKFAGSSLANRLPREKHYLHKAILKSMRAYHARQAIHLQIRDTLNDIKFLMDKGLFGLARKQLIQIKKLAYKFEMYHQLLDISEMESALISQVSNVVKYGKDIADERATIIKILENTNQYAQLHYGLLKLYLAKPTIKTGDDEQAYREILDQPLFNHSNRALSFQSKIYFYRAYQMYYFAKQALVEYENYSGLLVSLYEKNKEQISKAPENYAVALNNLLDIQRTQKHYGAFFRTLHKLRTFPSELAIRQDKRLASAIFTYGYNQEMYAYLDQGKIEAALNLLPDVLQGLEKHTDAKKSFLIYLYKNIARTYFLSHQYKKALDWLNKIINDADVRVRADIESFARILFIIIHYELGNNRILEYYVKSTYRFLLKKDNLNPVEMAILKFIRNELPKVVSQKQLIYSFQTLKQRLEKMTDQKQPQQSLENFDYISWLDSKVTGRDFAEIIKEKAQTANLEREI